MLSASDAPLLCTGESPCMLSFGCSPFAVAQGRQDRRSVASAAKKQADLVIPNAAQRNEESRLCISEVLCSRSE